MNEIATRLKILRDVSALSRKDIEARSNGRIKYSSLSTYENGQSNVSVDYLRRLVDFYESQGVSVSYSWLIDGTGYAPMKNNQMAVNLSSISEISLFQQQNPNSIVLSSDKSYADFIDVGDFLGGVKTTQNGKKLKLRILNIKDIGFIISHCAILGNNIFSIEDKKVSEIEINKVIDYYDVIWVRKNI